MCLPPSSSSSMPPGYMPRRPLRCCGSNGAMWACTQSAGMSTAGLAGKIFSSCSIFFTDNVSGKVTSKAIISLPFSKGDLYVGIPSSITHLIHSCLITSPGIVLMTMSLLSKVLMGLLKPHRASASEIFMFMMRSVPRLLKVSCSASSSTMMMSPGSMLGSWSPSPLNTIFWPSLMPLSTSTSRILRSCTTFLVTLSAEHDLLAVAHALVHVHLQDLALLYNLLAVAVLAAVLGVDALPRPPTLPTGGLHLRHHPRPQLLDPHLSPRALAGRATLGRFLAPHT